jgi:urease accessory protein
VESLLITREDALRKRLRATTDKGTECVIALPRDQKLEDGAILELGERAIIIRMADERWLALEPRAETEALELGYFCGNFHWRVKFKDNRILVALEGPEETYLERLQEMLSSGKARRVEDG